MWLCCFHGSICRPPWTLLQRFLYRFRDCVRSWVFWRLYVSYSYEIWNMFLGEINIHSRHNRVHDGRMLVSDSCYWSLIKRLQNGWPLLKRSVLSLSGQIVVCTLFHDFLRWRSVTDNSFQTSSVKGCLSSAQQCLWAQVGVDKSNRNAEFLLQFIQEQLERLVSNNVISKGWTNKQLQTLFLFMKLK